MFNANRLLENLTGYFEARIELLRVEAKDGISQGVSRAVYFAVLAFCGLLAFFCFNIAMAVLLNTLLDSPFWGYFIMFGFYALIIVVLLLNKRRVLALPVFQQALDEKLDRKKQAYGKPPRQELTERHAVSHHPIVTTEEEGVVATPQPEDNDETRR